MIRFLMTASLVIALAALGGCKKKPADDMADAPAPAPIEPSPAVMYPEPMPAPAPTYSGPAAGGSYVVQKGDTLWSIAKRTYGDGQRWKDITAANPGLTPEKLKVGQSIVLP